jgi:hypothetical protein
VQTSGLSAKENDFVVNSFFSWLAKASLRFAHVCLQTALRFHNFSLAAFRATFRAPKIRATFEQTKFWCEINPRK